MQRLTVEFLPIATVGLSWWVQWWNVLFKSRKFLIPFDQVIHDQMVPRGHIANGLSVPKPLRFLIDPFGVALMASVIHDFEIRYRVRLDKSGVVIKRNLTLKECDDRFREICSAVNDMPGYAAILHALLRTGSWTAWLKYRRKDRDGVNTWHDRTTV